MNGLSIDIVPSNISMISTTTADGMLDPALFSVRSGPVIDAFCAVSVVLAYVTVTVIVPSATVCVCHQCILRDVVH